MIKITCPKNNIPERKYAISVLLNELIGCGLGDDDICFDDLSKDYHIQVGQREIVIEDHFFNHYPEDLSYLDLNHIPDNLSFFHAKGFELPIIYGRDNYVEDHGCVTIGLDIFGSIFFMLTRWEESLLGREEIGDCDETKLFAVRMGFYQRPVVHEYEEFLCQLLSIAGVTVKARNYGVVLSHDVDGFLTPSFSKIVKDCVRQTIYGLPKNQILHLTWKEELKYKKAFPSDFDQFKFYTRLSERFNVPEWFYFKVCALGEVESTYTYNSERTRGVINQLQGFHNSRFVIGFHPSQSTFRNKEQWESEAKRIESLLGYVPVIGRNHHLLYNYDTLRNWERMASGTSEGVVDISNCVFHDKIGFRSGIGVGYTLFDIYQRRPMLLREHPCQIMDTIIRYHANNNTENEIWDEIKTVVNYAKKYRCELVLTWHIYIRTQDLIRRYYKWCERIICYANGQ